MKSHVIPAPLVSPCQRLLFEWDHLFKGCLWSLWTIGCQMTCRGLCDQFTWNYKFFFKQYCNWHTNTLKQLVSTIIITSNLVFTALKLVSTFKRYCLLLFLGKNGYHEMLSVQLSNNIFWKKSHQISREFKQIASWWYYHNRFSCSHCVLDGSEVCSVAYNCLCWIINDGMWPVCSVIVFICYDL